MNYTFNESVILFGGNSEERLVSMASAQNISGQLPEAALWFLAKDGRVYLLTKEEVAGHKDAFTVEFISKSPVKYQSLGDGMKDLKGKVVIMGLHGTEGEDGQLQKQFEEAGIKFTGTGSKASAVAFDKVATKELARKNKLPVVEELVVKKFGPSEISEVRTFMETHRKIVLKPNANGSSVGLFILSSMDELNVALEKLKTSTDSYLAEPFITGREMTVGVRQKSDGSISPLPCSEIRVIKGRQFDYKGKYLGSGVEELTPAPINSEEKRVCQELALKMHKALGCRGYTRTDMILTEKGPILLETNTLPGLSKASFIPQQLVANGENLRDFFLEQINLP
ncbi:MAG TPA: ATP-grasp domain-containing protein [Bacteriovoracaceae bacterium]|nr:ATP-grasp domain-containing protein [Bacteriovoracaceae bacterium]